MEVLSGWYDCGAHHSLDRVTPYRADSKANDTAITGDAISRWI
jgi:hypothetical protein